MSNSGAVGSSEAGGVWKGMGFLVGRGWSLCGEVSHGEGFRVGHGDVSSCPVWQGYRGSSAVRLGMVGHGEVW